MPIDITRRKGSFRIYRAAEVDESFYTPWREVDADAGALTADGHVTQDGPVSK